MIGRILSCCVLIFMMICPAYGFNLKLEPCMTGVEQMTDIKFVYPNNALITTQGGDIYWFSGRGRMPLKIASIDVSTSSWETGLYSIAIDPNFFSNLRIYLYYAIESRGQLKTRLSSFIVNPSNPYDALTFEKTLLEIDQPATSGNGGGLAFGPDGLLYLGVGDGGLEGDPDENAQNPENILGSIVRIKPDFSTRKGYTIPDGNLQDFISDALPEIFAYGVRNPWKFTFDMEGNLIIGDVGEHEIEEVDIIEADMIGEQEINLGWNIKEGDSCFESGSCKSKGLIDPVYQYEHEGDQGNSITGGEVIRHNGKDYYLFADFMTGKLSVLDLDDPDEPVFEKKYDANWVTFAKDHRFFNFRRYRREVNDYGNVYVADYDSGTLYQVVISPEQGRRAGVRP